MSYSIVIPMMQIIHFQRLHICGVSKRGSRTVSVHYDKNRNMIGKTIKNTFYQPNHYGINGEIRGYSRNKTRRRIVHFDSTGCPVGYSRKLLLGLIWIHFGLIAEKNVIYHLW